MSIVQDTVSPAYHDGFKLYAHGKEEVLRQFNIFGDNKSIEHILRRAFKNLSKPDKEAYIIEAARIKESQNVGNLEYFDDDITVFTNPWEMALFYQADIRHIIMQDEVLSRIPNQNMFALMWSVWHKLDAKLKSVYCKKIPEVLIKEEVSSFNKTPANFIDSNCDLEMWKLSLESKNC